MPIAGENSSSQHVTHHSDDKTSPPPPPGYCQCLEGSGAGGEGLRGVAADRDPSSGET